MARLLFSSHVRPPPLPTRGGGEIFPFFTRIWFSYQSYEFPPLIYLLSYCQQASERTLSYFFLPCSLSDFRSWLAPRLSTTSLTSYSLQSQTFFPLHFPCGSRRRDALRQLPAFVCLLSPFYQPCRSPLFRRLAKSLLPAELPRIL